MNARVWYSPCYWRSPMFYDGRCLSTRAVYFVCCLCSPQLRLSARVLSILCVVCVLHSCVSQHMCCLFCVFFTVAWRASLCSNTSTCSARKWRCTHGFKSCRAWLRAWAICTPKESSFGSLTPPTSFSAPKSKSLPSTLVYRKRDTTGRSRSLPYTSVYRKPKTKGRSSLKLYSVYQKPRTTGRSRSLPSTSVYRKAYT